MSIATLFLYSLCIFLFCIYLWLKYRNRAYIISIFNIGLYIYTFDILITPIFFYSDLSWSKLGIESAVTMHEYLNQALCVNAVGYILYIIVLALSEFNGKTPTRMVSFAKTIDRRIQGKIVDVVYIVFLVVWNLICFKYCNGYPLLNGKRTFYLNTSISPVYLLVNEVLLLCTFYYAVQFVFHNRKLVYLILGIAMVALQGNRAALITNLMLPIFVMYIYFHTGKKKIQNTGNDEIKIRIINKGIKKKAIVNIALLVPLLVVLGLWLQFVRKGGTGELTQMISELLFGNTFSDIRDGAYILKGFVENTGSSYLGGKTYLAALISFVPSSISEFRYIWSWGRYTTTGLFGFAEHFGLRGGNVMEAYINFSWFGVVISSVLQGVIGGKLEKVFYHIFICENVRINGAEYFVFYVIQLLNGALIASSNAYNIYVAIALIIGLVICSGFFSCRNSSMIRQDE